MPRATPSEILDATLRNALFWSDVQIFHLTQNMRLLARADQMGPQQQQTARAFAEWLIQIGDGRREIMNDDGTVALPPGMPQHFFTNAT